MNAPPGPSAIVVGAGIGGLMSALALTRRGFSVKVLERDPPPPCGLESADSMEWRRRGTPQALHPHFLMGRLRRLLLENYPDLVTQLRAAGIGEPTFESYLHPIAARRYRAEPADEILSSLATRRTTFEMVVREYVEKIVRAPILSNTRVESLIVEDDGQHKIVRGVTAECDDVKSELLADILVDASGRASKLFGTLGLSAAAVRVEQRESGIWYFTRHYRLRPGRVFPPSHGVPGVQHPDFIVGALPADNGALTVTFQIYREDRDIAKAMRDPAHFQAMCEAAPEIAPWVAMDRVEATSEVFGFGQMDCFWRRTVIDGRPSVLNYFSVGDAALRTNPKFGRGCTWSAVSAHLLAGIVASTANPSERIRRYEDALWTEFRSDWETTRAIDISTEAMWEVASGRRAATTSDRVAMGLQDLMGRATVVDPVVFRAVWSGYHGLTGMDAWMRSPRIWLHLIAVWLTNWRHRVVFDVRNTRPSRAAMATPTTQRFALDTENKQEEMYK